MKFKAMQINSKADELLKGKTIKSVYRENDSDEGLILEFTDGSILRFGYSSYEGNTWINDEEIEVSGYFD